MFPGRVTPMAAAGFVGLMSLFQHGRTFVLGLNVCLHRPQETYFCFFILGTMLYATVPCTGEIGSISLFVLCFLVIIRMYGGGFSNGVIIPHVRHALRWCNLWAAPHRSVNGRHFRSCVGQLHS
jgi:hypothetical protein